MSNEFDEQFPFDQHFRRLFIKTESFRKSRTQLADLKRLRFETCGDVLIYPKAVITGHQSQLWTLSRSARWLLELSPRSRWKVASRGKELFCK